MQVEFSMAMLDFFLSLISLLRNARKYTSKNLSFPRNNAFSNFVTVK